MFRSNPAICVPMFVPTVASFPHRGNKFVTTTPVFEAVKSGNRGNK